MNIRIDVRLIDREILRGLAAKPDQVVTCHELADQLKCSPLTVWRGMKRLQDAGCITRVDGSRKTGYVYKVSA